MISPRPKMSRIVDPDFCREWAARHLFCQTCGLSRQGACPAHSVSHIIGGAGRSDEACNLLLQCNRDHRLHHGHAIRVNGVLLPKITLAMLLWTKAATEPEEYNHERLTVLYGKPLPEPALLPELFVVEWATRRGLKSR